MGRFWLLLLQDKLGWAGLHIVSVFDVLDWLLGGTVILSGAFDTLSLILGSKHWVLVFQVVCTRQNSFQISRCLRSTVVTGRPWMLSTCLLLRVHPVIQVWYVLLLYLVSNACRHDYSIMIICSVRSLNKLPIVVATKLLWSGSTTVMMLTTLLVVDQAAHKACVLVRLMIVILMVRRHSSSRNLVITITFSRLT